MQLLQYKSVQALHENIFVPNPSKTIIKRLWQISAGAENFKIEQ